MAALDSYHETTSFACNTQIWKRISIDCKDAGGQVQSVPLSPRDRFGIGIGYNVFILFRVSAAAAAAVTLELSSPSWLFVSFLHDSKENDGEEGERERERKRERERERERRERERFISGPEEDEEERGTRRETVTHMFVDKSSSSDRRLILQLMKRECFLPPLVSRGTRSLVLA
jgi:hypothetical protein